METVNATEVVLPGIVEPSGLQLRTRQLPPPAKGQALVTVEASGVSFAEQAMRRGQYPMQPKFPFVPGYDMVGVVHSVGAGVDPALVGRRVAAMTKTGGWSSHLLVAADDLVAVPDGVDPGEAETLVVNGITAWQMLYRSARVRSGQTIVVHGANGGVGTTLAQLALLDGIRVLGVANPRHHDALRALGMVPLDIADPQLESRIRELAPDGVDAVFDNLGGEHCRRGWRLLKRGGALVSYGVVAASGGSVAMYGAFFGNLGRILTWSALPNGKRASFYDLWSGHWRDLTGFRARTRKDLTAVLALLAEGRLTAQVAARIPLARIAEAMTMAEARTVPGKVVVVPA
jgi:NADPH:quinone reductase-like Zn-dependent oxidoreductase